MECSCERHYPIDMDIFIERQALEKVGPFLESRGFRKVMMVADQHTYQAAGSVLSHFLSDSGITHHVCIIQPDRQGDVVADEASLMQVFLETSSEVEALLAVGAGTLHDIVRLVSYKMAKPFIAVPTAASVDGFTSAGAPLIIRATKHTYQATSPIAVFADLDVLCSAPNRLTAAGFGDMLAKYTSLVDWRFSHLLAGEPYCLTAVHRTQQALESCIRHKEEIMENKEEGIQVLMQALIESGLTMLLVGHSRSASGAEHHLSHYWEMEFMKTNKRQVLHGAKVGVATAIIAGLYQRVFSQLDPNRIVGLAPYFYEMKQWIEAVPDPNILQKLLIDAGAPSSPEELGISPEWVRRSLTEAYHIRDRYTILRFINEEKLWELG